MSYEEVEDCMPVAWKAAPDATSQDIANVRVNLKSTQEKIDGDAPVLGGTALAEYMEALPKLLAKAAGFNYTRDESSYSENTENRVSTRKWDSPAPFHIYDLPEFPTNALPGWMREFVVAEATFTQTP